MLIRTPGQVGRWLDANLYKFDLPAQWLGTEPNSSHRDWDSSSVRWLISASWPYEHGAGNQSIPAVCQAITDASPSYLADRCYLPATPRDMRQLERGEIPAFGVESRRSLGEFDVVGTSISYLVLLMSFTKMLSLSGVPLRWRDREKIGLEKFPMIIIGGQAYSAPGAMEPVADCLWLGEVEDEPGNPGGIGQVCARIALLKEEGLWLTDRLECYRQLALQFPHLHFPRFVQTAYRTEDRGLEHPSKQVASYRSLLPGMAFPRRSRKIIDMDKIRPLRSAPLLFADPALGAGDLEVARGSVAAAEYVLVRGQGPRQLGSWRGDALHPHDGDLGLLKADAGGQLADVSHVLMNGERPVVTVSTVGGHRVTCTPDHEISVVRGPAVDARKGPASGARAFAFSYGSHGRPSRLEVLSQQPREFVRADELASGADYIPVYYGQNIWSAQEQQLSVSGCHSEYSASVELPEVLDEDVAWLLGMLAGDVTIDNNKSSHTYALRIQTEDPGVAARTAQVLLRLFGRDVEPWTRDGARAGRLTFILQSAAVLRWLDLNFDITGNHTRRRVPELILRSPRHVVAAYVSGFYDSDGTYDDRTGRPSWCSGSEELIRVLSLLLLNLGAPCSWQRKATRGRFGSAPGSIWMVQGLQAPDGDWSWLHPVHTRRQAQLQRWHGTFAARNGREATGGVIYTPVREISDSGAAETYDLAVPEMSAFTCSGMLVHNCPAWCSFCRLSWLQKPYRQRSVPASVQHAKEWHRNMGAVELSPFGPDFPMHTQKKALIAALLEQVNDEADSVAMRVDDFIADGDYIMLQALGGMDAVTLGLEGNSQRMRDLVGKGTSDKDVEEAFVRGVRAGIRKFKLFMITNLPGEMPGDVMRIVKLARRLSELRDEMGQPNVRIQFSWTPLLIEAGTPFQWFAPTAADHTLIQVADEFRNYRIDFKIGTKAEPNKVAFFQLCQRGSAEVGEAIIDVLADLDTACWGGVPRDMRDRLDQALRDHGFSNGFADCFDERLEHDLFGWEYIDTGVSTRLMWDTYRQMVEFLENTEADTYDDALDPRYHGQEWVARCDTQCLGNTCGVCKGPDLVKRAEYIRGAAQEREIDLPSIRAIDQSSIACKIRARIIRPGEHRFVLNDHWRFSVRRAAYLAQDRLDSPWSIAKRSIRFASDRFSYKDWTTGTDYVEFGLTRRVPSQEYAPWVHQVRTELAPWLELTYWEVLPSSADLRKDSPLAFIELPVSESADRAAAAIRVFEEQPYLKLVLRSETAYFGLGTEEVNLKDYLEDIWLAVEGSRLVARFYLRGPASPYQAYAALLGKASWIEAARSPAVRRDFFTAGMSGRDALQPGFLAPPCTGCGLAIPESPLGVPWDEQYCPRCHDESRGVVVAAPARRLLV